MDIDEHTLEKVITFLLLFKYSCLHFTATTFLLLTHTTSHPQSFLHLALSMCPLYMFLFFLYTQFPFFLPLGPSHLPSGYH